jgi:hypothetical protein
MENHLGNKEKNIKTLKKILTKETNLLKKKEPNETS